MRNNRLSLILIAILASGCALQLYSPAELGSTASSTATVSITTPSEDGENAGWLKHVAGTCSENGNSVIVSSGSALASTTCASNAWEVYLDISSLGTGSNTITASHPDSAGVAAQGARSINKFSSNCDSSADRIKNYASNLAAGDGSKATPYVVCTPDQLQEMSNGANDHLSIESDIYFSYGDSNGDGVIDGSDTDYRSGTGWPAINRRGSVLGNSMGIYDLYINNPTTDDQALFSGGAAVRNLRLHNPQVTGQDHTGALFERSAIALYDIKVINPTIIGRDGVGAVAGEGFGQMATKIQVVGGSVSGNGNVGGIFGKATYMPISGAINSASVTATSSGAGGIAGRGSYSTNCFMCINKGNVNGVDRVGGIFGEYDYENNIIHYSYNNASISGSSGAVGGLVGYCRSEGTNTGRINDSFNVGNVRGDHTGSDVGLLTGQNASCVITNSHSVSDATCTNVDGGGTCNTDETSSSQEKSDLYSKTSSPLSVWDFDDSLADGYSDFWQAQGSDFPILWFEATADNSTAASTFSGDGSSGSPYQITGASDFEKIASNPRYVDKHFSVTANMDISSLGTFIPVGAYYPFMATFDGGNNSFTNVNRTQANFGNFGMFAMTHEATIKNVSVDNPTLVGNFNRTGGLVGYAMATTFNSTHIINGGSVTGVNVPVGGLLGQGYAIVMDVVSSTANATGTYKNVGSLVGNIEGQSFVSNAFATGDVSGANVIGGLIGFFAGPAGSTMSNCYSTGNVTATGYLSGGLLGEEYWLSVSNCFATGNVSGSNASDTVGLAHGSDSSIGAYYWSGATCTNSGAGNCNARGTAEATLTNLYNPSLAPLSAWDFGSIWQDNSPGGPPTFQ